MRLPIRGLILAIALIGSVGASAQEATGPTHGMAIYGDLKYGPDFEHFDYVNPDAPKGGKITLAAIGSFDSFNPFIIKGTPAAGIGLLFETLTVQSLDEPFSEYGLIAESVEVPEDRSFVRFNLRPEARWHDGQPITVEDVVWSFDTLKEKGHPRYRAYYANVARAEETGERQVTFYFDGKGVNRELPLIVGQLPILPKHYYETVDFAATSLEPPIGSGPYRVSGFDAGRSVTYERVRDYWGADLPVNKGRNNFDTLEYQYYRDSDIALEAFKAGQFDLRGENSAKLWATGYTGPAVDKGFIRVEELPIKPPARMQGWIFNLRKEKFQDPRVREALELAFDFEWSNKTLMYDQYERLTSYFHGDDDLASSGLPGEGELALLEPLRGRVPEEVFSQQYAPAVTDGSGNNRANLRRALELLGEAGWEVKDGALRNSATGEPFTFEMLFDSPASERLAAPYIQNLKRLGIDASIRTIDSAQYQNRVDAFDFDVITDIWAQSESPGNEQRDYWGSAAADVPGSRNTIGIKDPAIDELIDAVIRAESREDLANATKALDRVLLWNHFLVPHFVDDGLRLAWWDKFGMPDTLPDQGLDLFAWWVDPAKEQRLRGQQHDAASAG